MAKRDADDILREQGPDALRDLIDRKVAANEVRRRARAAANGADPAAPLAFLDLAALDGRPVPSRSWMVQDRIPGRTVTLLTGDGGVGKSMVAKQLAVATVLGRDWLGSMPEPGPVIFLTAEDDEIELHIRLAAIVESHAIRFRDLAGLHLLSLAGKDAALAIADRRNVMQPTPLFQRLVRSTLEVRPRLIVIDTVADSFLGDENNRSQVRQYIAMLRGIAVQAPCAVLLLAHPSLTGINTGSGMSGSTAWSNSVRSRMYLKPAGKDDDSDPDLRELQLMKANYAKTGERIKLRWLNGLFVLEGGPGGLEKMAADRRVDDVFMALLHKTTGQGFAVSPHPSSTYAPAQFIQHPEAAGIPKRQFEAAMHRLLDAGRVRVVSSGAPSRLRSRLVPVAIQPGLPLA